ncbi:MAG: hypothetical protein ORN85_03550, partial [Sediminibacterium sp.]|nr:hypothetical protein [Sediminibacterium sp.]
NRTTKYKNDCKIVDFSYKNVNVKNIKAAFEHFSNVVVSDFDPLGDEGKLEIYYKELKAHSLLVSQYPNFLKYHQDKKNINLILEMQNTFSDYIRKNKVDAKKLKGTINNYFKILNLIEFVIELDAKYSNALFLDYLRKYNNEYNNIYKPTDIIDDVEVYFDNKIGIVVPLEPVVKDKTKGGVKGGVKGGTTGTDDNKFKYNILKVIEKRNKEEEAIAEMIKDFEAKIETFFEYIHTINDGKRLIAKIRENGKAFSQDEIYIDFSKIYRKYIIVNKDLGEFFKRETKDILTQLCDDFEKTLGINNYVLVDFSKKQKTENLIKTPISYPEQANLNFDEQAAE